jgi:hypothetical protein
MRTKFDITWYNTHTPGIEKLKMDTSNGIMVESLSVGNSSEQDSWSLEYYLSSDANLDLQEWKIKCFHLNTNRNPIAVTHQLYLERKNNQWTGHLDSETVGPFASTKYIDISSTPFTNYFPIRELIQNGKDEATFKVLFVEVPKLSISLKDQIYKKVGHGKFSYQSKGSPNVYTIEVDDNGITISYDNLWQRIINPISMNFR